MFVLLIAAGLAGAASQGHYGLALLAAILLGLLTEPRLRAAR